MCVCVCVCVYVCVCHVFKPLRSNFLKNLRELFDKHKAPKNVPHSVRFSQKLKANPAASYVVVVLGTASTSYRGRYLTVV